MRWGRSFLVAAALLATALASACSQGGDEAPAPTPTPGPNLAISDAAGRAVMGRGAVYMRITNTGTLSDYLVGASSPAARTVEVHETVMEGAMSQMRPVARVEVPANGELVLKPGGYHIMMMDLERDLKVGDVIEVTLSFEKSGRITISVPVRDFSAT
jgi:copper(I)-binding protein